LTPAYVKIGDEYFSPHHPKAKAHAEFMGGLGNTERKPDALPALVNREKTQRGRKARVDLCVKIVSVRQRDADSDNIIAGAKPLRDAIARQLGVDDGSKRIMWEYDILVSKGTPGTFVILSTL
jgi:hypothetical protein